MGFSPIVFPVIAVFWTLPIFLGADAAKVLFFNGMGEGSHYTAATPVAEALVSRGVSVTFVLSDSFRYRSEHPLHSDIFQFEIIQTRATKHDFEKRPEPLVMAAMQGASVTELVRHFMHMQEQLTEDCKDLFQNKILLRIKASGYDLAVYDPTWPCSLLLAEYLNVTKVAFIPSALPPAIVRYHGNPLNPALVAEAGLGIPVKMDFWTRVRNVFLIGLHGLMLRQKTGYDLIRDRFNIQNDWIKSAETTALVLASSDPIIDQKIPTMPHVKLIGGITTRPSNPLPKDLEAYMQSSGDHGVIILSLGSYVTHLPEELVNAFRDAFRRLPQRIILQWKNQEPPRGMSDNVETMEWLPQNDLLGHNKTKLLFYQGGNNGLYEAIYHGVPLLVLPIIGDQPDVAQRVVEAGVGLKLDVTTVTSDNIVEAVTTILSNPKYRTNVDLLSAIFRDRPQHPRDRAAFWIEHVIKHGAEHFRSPVHDLNFIQLNMIDVYLFLVIILSMISFVVYRFLKFICRTMWLKCCSKEKRKSD